MCTATTFAPDKGSPAVSVTLPPMEAVVTPCENAIAVIKKAASAK
jgi:hypothetical protein